MTEPCHDIAHLAHVEMLTDRFDESLDFFTRVYGLKLSALDGDSAYLRAWDDYEFHSLKLTRSRHHRRRPRRLPRRARPRRSARRVAADRGLGLQDPSAGPRATSATAAPSASRTPSATSSRSTTTPSGTSPGPEAERAALKNTASAFTGAAPRRLDHVNLLAEDVTEFRRFMETCLGSPRHRADPARQRPARRLLVHRQQQDLRPRLHRGAWRRPWAAAPRHLRHRPARGHPARRRHLPAERRPHRDRPAQARDPGHLLPLRLGAGGQPRRARQRRRAADPRPGLGARGLDRGRPEEGPGLGAQDHRELPHPRHPAGEGKQKA